MRRGRMFVLGGLGLVVSMTLIGCFTLGERLESLPRPFQAKTDKPRNDIPLVPLPSLPLDKPGACSSSPPPPEMPSSCPLPSPTPMTEISSSAPKNETLPPPPKTAPPAPAVVTPRALYEAAKKEADKMDSYIARLTRREKVRDTMNPEELILFKFRKAPWSVSLKWLGKENTGREVLYVQGKHEGKIHSLLAAGDIPFMPAGKRMALAPDNPLVRSASRHPVTQAGIAASIERLGRVITALERDDKSRGTIALRGPLKRDEFAKQVYAIDHTIPAGVDPSLPKGGTRTYHFDPENKLPTLITTVDDKNEAVEYYRYDRLQFPVKLDDDDFNPDKLWAKPASAKK